MSVKCILTGQYDVGAVRKTGDTITGNLVIDKSSVGDWNHLIMKAKTQAGEAELETDGKRARLSQFDSDNTDNNRRYLDLFNHDSGIDISGALTLYDVTDGTSKTYKVYHEGYKPSYTAAEVGALASGGTAVAANKLANARTITLSGDASGSVSFDGSANVTLTVAVANNSHTHAATNITAGTLVAEVVAATGTDYTTSRLRNIAAGTAAPTSLTNGTIYLVYEA